MSEIKLLPCPFCGGEAEYIKSSREEIFQGYMPVIKCESCGAKATLTDSDIGNYEEILTRKWNTRKPMQEIVERLEDFKNDFENKRYGKKHCQNMLHLETCVGRNCFECVLSGAIEIVKEVGGMNDIY